MAFKRIIYPDFIWVESVLGTMGLSFLVRLIIWGFVALVSSVVSSVYNITVQTELKESLKRVKTS